MSIILSTFARKNVDKLISMLYRIYVQCAWNENCLGYFQFHLTAIAYFAYNRIKLRERCSHNFQGIDVGRFNKKSLTVGNYVT